MVLPRTRLLRLLVAVALVTLAAAGLRLSEGDGNDFEAVRGRLGEAVTLEDGTVTARDVRIGTALARDDEVYATTPGLFVVVRLETAATGRTKMQGYDGEVLTATRRYAEYSATSTALVPPGFRSVQDLIFEVDPTSLADLTLDLDPGGVLVAYPEHARIHLGITAANEEAWRAAGRDQVLAPEQSTTGAI